MKSYEELMKFLDMNPDVPDPALDEIKNMTDEEVDAELKAAGITEADLARQAREIKRMLRMHYSGRVIGLQMALDAYDDPHVKTREYSDHLRKLIAEQDAALKIAGGQIDA